MGRMTFINLPVRDVAKTREFFSNLGFDIDPGFSNEMAACVVISDDTRALMLAESFFQNFTSRDIADAGATTEVAIALSTESEAEADAIIGAVEANGGEVVRTSEKNGHMYGGAFNDPDNHLWEIFYMEGPPPMNDAP